MTCIAGAMPLRCYSFQASKTAPQQAPQPQLASKPAPKQPVPVPDQPQEQRGPCGSTPPSTAPKAKQQSKADADKLARDELMQRRDWPYKDGYKPRWIICCNTAIALMIVEGAEIKPAGAKRAPQDHVAVIIPNDQWSPSQQGEEEEEEDDWSEFMPSCQVFSAKSKAYEELDKWQSWWETYEPDEIVDLCPDPKTMRMSPSKPPTPKKKQAQGDPPAQPPAPPQEDEEPAEATSLFDPHVDGHMMLGAECRVQLNRRGLQVQHMVGVGSTLCPPPNRTCAVADSCYCNSALCFSHPFSRRSH